MLVVAPWNMMQLEGEFIFYTRKKVLIVHSFHRIAIKFKSFISISFFVIYTCSQISEILTKRL